MSNHIGLPQENSPDLHQSHTPAWAKMGRLPPFSCVATLLISCSIFCRHIQHPQVRYKLLISVLTERSGIHTYAVILKISASPATPAHLLNKYTDRDQRIFDIRYHEIDWEDVKWRYSINVLLHSNTTADDWQPWQAETKEMKSLALRSHSCLFDVRNWCHSVGELNGCESLPIQQYFCMFLAIQFTTIHA